MNRLLLLVLLAPACGDWCHGIRASNGACVVGLDERRAEVAAGMVAAVYAVTGAGEPADEWHERHETTYRFDESLGDDLQGVSGWKVSQRPYVARMQSDILARECLADTALIHEALHVSDMRLHRGVGVQNHSYGEYFVRRDRADNPETIEFQLDLDYCAEQCPRACRWEGLFAPWRAP